MALILILQQFDFTLDDPSYTLSLKQTLTIKPNHFYIHATPRQGRSKFFAAPTTQTAAANGSATTNGDAADGSVPKQPLYVLYGSNTGSSETFAQRIASAAASHGESAIVLRPCIMGLTTAFDRLPRNFGHFRLGRWPCCYRRANCYCHGLLRR